MVKETFKGVSRMASKQRRKHTLLVIRKMKIKFIVRCHFTTIKIATIKKMRSMDKDVGTGIYYSSVICVTWYICSGEQFGRSFKSHIWNHRISYNGALGTIPEKN